jgi:hypothetical protein
MRNLKQHSGTVAGLIISALRAPVFHPFKNFQALFQNSMGRAALDIRDKAYSTGIMLIFFSVKTLGETLVSPLFILAHDGSLV